VGATLVTVWSHCAHTCGHFGHTLVILPVPSLTRAEDLVILHQRDCTSSSEQQWSEVGSAACVLPGLQHAPFLNTAGLRAGLRAARDSLLTDMTLSRPPTSQGGFPRPLLELTSTCIYVSPPVTLGRSSDQGSTPLQCAQRFCGPRGIYTEVSKGEPRFLNSMH
jgi:hypothetical protein